MTNNSKHRKSSWGAAFSEMKTILFNAIKSVRFVTTFIVFIIVGGSGVWLPWLVSNDDVRLLNSENLFTFSLPVLGMLLMEWALVKDGSDDKAVIGVCVGILALILCFSGFLLDNEWSNSVTLLGSVFTLLLFVLANANHGRFDSIETAASSTGYRDPDVNKLREGKE